MNRATDEDLRRYGFTAGTLTRWCAACNREEPGLGPKAFKCKPCAVKQWREVEKICESVADDIPENLVPGERI